MERGTLVQMHLLREKQQYGKVKNSPHKEKEARGTLWGKRGRWFKCNFLWPLFEGIKG